MFECTPEITVSIGSKEEEIIAYVGHQHSECKNCGAEKGNNKIGLEMGGPSVDKQTDRDKEHTNLRSLKLIVR
jgi:hypothetical protein